MSRDALAARLQSLSAEDRALLAHRLAARRGEQPPAIAPRDPDEPVPMSFAQWRLWFLEQLRPGTNAWNTPVAARVHGPLQADALRRSVQCLVDRHPTLRTVFAAPGGKPDPVLLDQPEAALPIVDAPAQPGSGVQALINEEVGRPFDLERDLMLRPSLIRLAPDEHILVLVAHHIACDGWSKGLLLEELSRAYEAFSAGQQPDLPTLPIEYADFAVWQRSRLSGERLDELVAYWRSRLAGSPPALELSCDHARPRTQAFRGAVRWVSVPARIAQPALALGRGEGATPFMTILAAFKVLLHAHSGQDDILVGSPAAMRTHPELERIVGCFANTLVYRTSLAREPSFRQLVRRVRETALGVFEHQELPFEKIVEAVRPPRDASRNPLVQANLRLEGAEPQLRLQGTRCEQIPLDPGIARFDLAIELAPDGEGFAGYLEYDTALFERATAAAFARDFNEILEACVGLPDDPIAGLAPVQAITARSA